MEEGDADRGQPLSIGFVDHLQRGKTMHDVILQVSFTSFGD
jgi:hypothetical protein